MSSRQQIDSVIDDDDEFWYVFVDDLFFLSQANLFLPTAPCASRNSICPTKTSNPVLVDTR